MFICENLRPIKFMNVKPLYLDFFRFLDQIQENDPWASYQRLYFHPHEKFFQAYWETFNHFDLEQIRERVRQIKEGDYSLLRSLIQSQDPVPLAEEALRRCQSVLPLSPEPPVYLFVGFFSADGATVEVEGSPSIALGMERFKDFRDLSLLVSHEYCHCVQRSLLKEFFPPEDVPCFLKSWRKACLSFSPGSFTRRSPCTGTSF